MNPRQIFSLIVRAGITAAAFWWISRMVDLPPLLRAFSTAHRGWLLLAIGYFFLAQIGCITRWSFLTPKSPLIHWKFLANSFFIGSFFNFVLPTTIGGDVTRSYDLIKATGQWREAIASVLVDRLIGMSALVSISLIAWFLFPMAQQDAILRWSFLGFCLLVATIFGILGSRRVLHSMLRPFSRIGLGQLQSHAKQFQETLLSYLHRPSILICCFIISLGIQVCTILLFASIAQALHLSVPLAFLFLIVPIATTVAQLPISLNGLGIREGAMILFLHRIGIEPTQALSLSLICAAIPLTGGMIGGLLFLTRRRHRKKN